MPTDPKYLATVAARRAARRAAGTCVECGEPRAPHDPLLCAKHRTKARKYHRTTYARTVGHMPRKPIASHPPKPPTGCCPKCYDMPWRRPKRKPCVCGGRREVEVVRYGESWCWRQRGATTWE